MQVLDGGGISILSLERIHQVRASHLETDRRQPGQPHPGAEYRIGFGHCGEVIAPAIEDQRTDVVSAVRQELGGNILLRNSLGDLPQIEAHLHPQAAPHHFIVFRGHVVVASLETPQLPLVIATGVVGLAGINHWQRIRHPAGGQSRVQRIVVPRGNGIELVIVASGASHGQPHQASRNDINLVVDHIVPVAVLHANGEEPQPREGRIIVLQTQLVGGDLLGDKPLVRHVGVEGADDVIPVRIRERKPRETNGTPTMSVGVAREIEPVTAPTLPVARRIEQPIQHLLAGIG